MKPRPAQPSEILAREVELALDRLRGRARLYLRLAQELDGKPVTPRRRRWRLR